MPEVDLVYDLGCPNVVLARTNLMRAFSKAGIPARWLEHKIGEPEALARVRGFGSPTVLVDGRDVAPASGSDGNEPGSELCCRVYGVGSSATGAPSVEEIAAALLSAAAPPETSPMQPAPGPSNRSRWGLTLAAMPGLGIALMPKVICPLCWPAYAGLLSATGLTFLMTDTWLFPIIAALLLVALVALAWKAKTRRGHGPVTVGVVATAAILAGRFALNSNVAIYVGVAALVATSIWNVWPRRAAAPNCPACVRTQS
jgi:mercuric ion transport protein